MAYEFIVERWPSGRIERTLRRKRMLARVAIFTVGAKRLRFRDRPEGEPRSEWGPWIKRLAGLKMIAARTAKGEAGDRFFVERKSDRLQLRIWKIEGKETEPVPDLGCAPELEKIHHWLFTTYGTRIRSGGRGFCRFVSGTSTVSRHGYKTREWFGAAEDIFVVSPNTMEFLEEVADALVAEARKGNLHPREVIVNRRKWRSSTDKWEFYSGDRHFHIHGDVPGGEPCEP